MPISAERINQIKRVARRALPVGVAVAAGAATMLTGAPRPAESSPLEMTSQAGLSVSSGSGEECSFKIGAVSVWLKSEPPADLQNAGNPLWEWTISNNQLGGPAGQRILDISAEANNRVIGTMITDDEGVGITEGGSTLIRAEAPKQLGVKRFFKGEWRDTALVKIFDRATNRTHVHEALCDCTYNARVPRWMKAQITPTVEPTATPALTQEVPATPTPSPTPGEVCSPVHVQLPCRTKESLFNPNQLDSQAEIGRSRLGNIDFVMLAPDNVRANLISQRTSRP